MNTSKISIGLIGSGFIARTHAYALTHSINNARLAGIAGGSRSQRLADEFSVQCYSSVQSLVSSPDIDAVIITTPHHLHAEHALIAAQHRKHALVEKPMATSVDACKTMLDAFDKYGLTLMVAFTQRFRQSNKITHDLLRQNTIGRILMVQEYALLADGSSKYPAWQQQKENLGILFGYGIHNIDKLRWLLQDEPSSIQAKTIHNATGIETSTMATMQWRNGTLVNLWSSVDLPQPGIEHSAFRSVIIGETGMIDADGYGAVRLARDGNPWETIFVQPPIDWQGDGMFSDTRMGSFTEQDQSFIDSILGKHSPPVTGFDGLRSVEIVKEIYSAARSGKTIFFNSQENF